MPNIQKKIDVPYSTSQMYDLLTDFSAYPQFVPACVASETLEHLPDEGAVSVSLSFQKGGVVQSFSTKNRLIANRKIEQELIDGPFKTFTGTWEFNEVATGTELLIDVKFEFSNMMYRMMFSSVFEKIFEDMVQAFLTRAQELYGS